MSGLLKFLIGRLISIPLTLLVITAVLYGIIMLAPPEVRAELYLPERYIYMDDEQQKQVMATTIRRYGLNDPYPIQYGRWALRLLQGEWGWAISQHDYVLPGLIRRTPVTAELTIYSLLVFIPLGLAGGAIAGWRRGRLGDHSFRLMAFVGTSIPSFILGLVLLSVFYASLHWFPPERLGISMGMVVSSSSFRIYSGLLTVDGLLNGRPDITMDALRHLVLPVFTLGLAHWATLGRLTRMAMIEELDQDYVTAARARGLSEKTVIWGHAFRNAALPALTNSALATASLVTGVFVVELLFSFQGVSGLMVYGMGWVPDAPPAMGFAVYSVLVVLLVMLILDVLQVIVDPRLRQGRAQ